MADEDELDEDAILEQAKLLSMQQAQESANQAALNQPQLAELMDNDFVGQIVKDLNLDMNENEINSLLNEVGIGAANNEQARIDEEERKKKQEEEKKQ